MVLMVQTVLVVTAVGVSVVLYNRLVGARNTAHAAWSDIDVILQKRYNLVENLVETVKGYAAHEKETLIAVTEARASAAKASGPMAKGQTENAFQERIASLFALSEAYPDLKGDDTFLRLQDQLQEIENNIAYARRYYNAVVRDYNTRLEAFPSNLVAAQFSFHRESFLEIEEPAARQPVKVQFG